MLHGGRVGPRFSPQRDLQEETGRLGGRSATGGHEGQAGAATRRTTTSRRSGLYTNGAFYVDGCVFIFFGGRGLLGAFGGCPARLAGGRGNGTGRVESQASGAGRAEGVGRAPSGSCRADPLEQTPPRTPGREPGFRGRPARGGWASPFGELPGQPPRGREDPPVAKTAGPETPRASTPRSSRRWTRTCRTRWSRRSSRTRPARSSTRTAGASLSPRSSATSRARPWTTSGRRRGSSKS